jgi:hypothetical protein
MGNEVKLVRLRDIVIYHLKEVKNSPIDDITMGQIDDLERDINVYIKNFLMTLEGISGKVDISFLGDNNEDKKALVCD